MANLYHFFITRKTGATRENLEAILNSAPDWFRYYDTCYIVETTQTPKQWEKRLESVIKPDGSLFICKLDKSHYWGLMQETFWKWYQSKAPIPED
jgi:hypothetical protein